MSVRVTELGNGLRVVSETMAHLQSAAVGVWVSAGGRAESEAENGIAHMLEHMAFKGTTRRDAFAIASEIEAVGGHLNAYTGREQTAYFARVLQEDVPLAVDILADILRNSVFDPKELERERDVVVQEIGQSEDTPDDILFDYLQEISFPNQSLGRPILGSVEKVKAMDRELLAGFMAKHYGGRNMLLCAAGAVDHDELVRLAEAQLGDLAEGGSADLESAKFVGGEYREERELEQAHVALSFPGFSYQDEDYFASQVMAATLGGGMSSRLFQEVRERRGLCYSVFAFASPLRDGGTFGIYAGTGPEQVAELVPVVCDELLRLGEDASEEEVARARAQMKAGLLMSLEAPASRVEQLARQMFVYGRPLSMTEIVDAVEAVDAAAVKRVVKRVVSDGRLALAAIGPLSGLENYPEIAAKFG